MSFRQAWSWWLVGTAALSFVVSPRLAVAAGGASAPPGSGVGQVANDPRPGLLTGRVLDDQDAALPGVTVRLRSEADPDVVWAEVAGHSGRFRFDSVPAGAYRLVVSLDGFSPYESEPLDVPPEGRLEHNPRLTIATMAEAVEITAERPEMDIRKSGVSTNLRFVQIFPRRYFFGEVNFGLYRSSRADLLFNASRSTAVSGVSGGIMFPREPAYQNSDAFFARASLGIVHDNWVGLVFEGGWLRNSDAGFWGGGVGVWGLGDFDVTDLGLFAAKGFNLPYTTVAGRSQIFVEGRLFVRQLGQIQDNFALSVGFRVNWKPFHRTEIR